VYTPFSESINKMLGIVLMTAGFFMATPPGFIPDDFIDMIIADWLVTSNFPVLGQYGLGWAIFFTYTIIAWGFIYAGALVYPRNTKALVNGKYNLFKQCVYKIFSSPVYMFLAAVSFGISIWIFYNYKLFLEMALEVI